MNPRSDAPGLEYRARKNGERIPYWRAPRKAVKAGFKPSLVRLTANADPDALAARCRVLMAEALEYIGGNFQTAPAFDGTFGSLTDIYERDEDSPFRRVKWNTRDLYIRQLKILRKTKGHAHLAKLTGKDFAKWYREARAPKVEGGPERVVRANKLMNMVRLIIGFGVVLDLPHCAKLAIILKHMRFENGPPREAFLTADMVVRFCAKAHEMGRPSLALATALQFEAGLRQKDVIGEWTPMVSEPGPLARRGLRWTLGLVWGEHINSDLILRKPTSKSRGRKIAEVDLKLCPMVMAELEHVPPERRVGPVIIHEATGQPFGRRNFLKHWRAIARSAGLPDTVCSMDARAGAITEASDANADGEHLRTFATHANLNMTRRYNRTTLTKTGKVMVLRVAHRNKEGE